ncbi:hypothetical protein ABZZ79_37705 [Streptomyces sp. NPDC006458]|uniref:hypothetical protein n=1 Tax=Streptomyces sp. NPDC006458 TaxID=3154302 RepID=UPI0033A0747D
MFCAPNSFDEGGRRLRLVARLAESRGTPHGREGNVIRREQALSPRAQRLWMTLPADGPSVLR